MVAGMLVLGLWLHIVGQVNHAFALPTGNLDMHQLFKRSPCLRQREGADGWDKSENFPQFLTEDTDPDTWVALFKVAQLCYDNKRTFAEPEWNSAEVLCSTRPISENPLLNIEMHEWKACVIGIQNAMAEAVDEVREDVQELIIDVSRTLKEKDSEESSVSESENEKDEALSKGIIPNIINKLESEPAKNEEEQAETELLIAVIKQEQAVIKAVAKQQNNKNDVEGKSKDEETVPAHVKYDDMSEEEQGQWMEAVASRYKYLHLSGNKDEPINAETRRQRQLKDALFDLEHPGAADALKSMKTTLTEVLEPIQKKLQENIISAQNGGANQKTGFFKSIGKVIDKATKKFKERQEEKRILKEKSNELKVAAQEDEARIQAKIAAKDAKSKELQDGDSEDNEDHKDMATQ